MSRKTITVEYFAILREHVGAASEAVATEASTARELYDELAAKHAFPELQSVKVAINDEFADWQAALASDDRVVFIPPVAGG